MFGRVLVANRGEIAVRVLRTLHELGIDGIAVYSDADANALHVRQADGAVRIGESPAPLSYLNPSAVVQAALDSHCEAVHPGYGFLSENAMFARACEQAGLAFIGPPPAVLELTGDKVAAREAFAGAGFPVLPGGGPYGTGQEALAAVAGIGYPVMVKAVMGGGGIGMGVARDDAELAKQVETASARGARFFADPAVYLERYVDGARHVEVQVLFDRHREGTHLYERECSVQRRHQKVIEEAPSPAVDDALLERMAIAALEAMRLIGYQVAGTVETILTPKGEFFFLEVNARLQVEHCVTEETCGVDLVEAQVRGASGEPLASLGLPAGRAGHAIECRVYAEDPDTFLPSPGTIEKLELPEGVRCDFGYEAGDEVPMFYDPLIGKVVAHAEDRPATIAAMRSALEALVLEGPKTNIETHLRVLDDDRFVAGDYDTGILGR
ncbi:MAG TPA: biotin carboxylase N-terminal domain-containing protein [Actinomycetota bacterium]|nr:biotin carboxylase N-terminal domain-containing protein [Actinomycetota bacterium]